MKYQLVFQGELTEALTEQEAVVLFAELFGISEELAKDRFFSGRVVLKNLDDFQKAVRYRERLKSMGIVAVITEVESPSSTSGKLSEQTPSGVKKPGSARKKGGGKVLAGVGVLVLVALAAGLYLIASRYTHPDVPDQVARAETALLTPETIVLGHANIARLVDLDQVLTDTSEGDYRYNPSGEGLFNALLGQGVNVRQDVEQVVFAAGYSESTGSFLSAVFIGTIDSSALRRGLEDYYDVSERLQDELTILELTRQDRYTCEVSRPIALISDSDTVVVSHPDKVLALYRAVTASGTPGVVNQQWVDYRSRHLASVGILQPDNLAKGQQGFAGMLLHQMSGNLNGAESLFAGVSAELVPPGGSFDIALNSKDKAWVSQTRSALDSALSERREASREEGGFTAQILQRISLSQSPGILGASFKVDAELVDAGRKAFRDGIGGLVSFGESGGFASGGEPLPEQVDENAERYQANIRNLQLPPFEQSYNRLYHWKKGPLAVGVQAFYLNPEQRLELKIGAAAKGIPNAPGNQGGDSGALLVTSVRDNGGQELMVPETCGREINSDPASFEPSFQKGDLSAKKTIRLLPEVSTDSIAVVEGEVSLPIAIKTRTTVISSEDGEMTIEEGDMYLRIKSLEGSTVRFVISGDEQRLLSVRGLNGDGQYLQRASSSSMGDANRGKKNVTAQFQGTIASVEVVTAVEWMPIQHQFQITRPRPLQNDASFQREPETPQPYDLNDWSNVLELARTLEPNPGNSEWLGAPQTVQRTETGILSLFRTEISPGFKGYGANGYVKLDMPFVEALDGYQGRVVLAIEELGFADHDPVAVDFRQGIPLSFTGFGDNYKNSNKTQAELRKDIYLDGQTQFSVPLGAEGEALAGATLRSVSGELIYRLPQSFQSATMESITLGDTLSASDTSITVIGLATGSVTLTVDGDVGDVLKILVLDAEGKQIGDGSHFSEEMLSGMRSMDDDTPRRMVSKITFNGEPEALRLITVTDTAERRYPVTLLLQ